MAQESQRAQSIEDSTRVVVLAYDPVTLSKDHWTQRAPMHPTWVLFGRASAKAPPPPSAVGVALGDGLNPPTTPSRILQENQNGLILSYKLYVDIIEG